MLKFPLVVPLKRPLGRDVSSESVYDPLSNPNLVAFYTALDAASVTPTQWLDQTTNNHHATKVGAVTYDAANAVAGGYPAMVWPASPVADQGFLLPAMTIKQMIVVMAYGNGTETTLGGVNAMIISGVSGASGNPLTLFNQSNNSIFTTMGATRESPETPVNGLPKANGTILPLPFQVQNISFGTSYTETNWKLGYRDDAAPTQSFRGVMSMVFMYDEYLTAEEEYQLYSYINNKLNKDIPIPSFVYTKTELLIPAETVDPLRSGIPYYPCVVDMADVPDFPYEWAIYASTDHSSVSGIFMWVGNGSPADPTILKSYTQAVIDGDFDYLPVKPAMDPIYEDTVAGTSTETPHVWVIDGQTVMTYQQAGVGNNQSTLTAVSPDGVNFTRVGVTVDYAPGTAVGDGHTGYLHWARNPFPDAINPATGLPWSYIGYSLHGGTIKFFMAQWGCENPATDVWTKTAILMSVRGRTASGYTVPTYGSIGVAFNSLDLSTVLYDPNYNGYRMAMTLAPQVAGGGGRINETYEVVLDSTGTQVLAMPQKTLARGGAGTYDEYQASDLDFLSYGGGKSGIYYAAATGDVPSVAGVTTTIRPVDITKFYPILPAIPPTTTLEADFTSLSALPAWMSSVAIGTTAPTLTFTSSGLELAGTNAGATPGEIYLFADPALIPDNVGYIEIWVEGMSTTSTNKQRVPFIGMADSKSVFSSINNSMYLSNNLTTSAELYKRQKIATVDSGTASTYYYGIGYANNSATAPKRLGIRWFVGSNLCYILGESGQEFENITVSGSFDKTIGYYPYFGVQFKNTGIVERISKFTVKYG